MLIIAGFAEVDASERDDYVAAHRDLIMRCRRAPGCLDVAISADPINAKRVNVLIGRPRPLRGVCTVGRATEETP